MRVHRFFPLAFPLVASSLLACGSGASAPAAPSVPPVDVAKSSLARDTAPAVAPADQAEVVAGNTAFAIDLYRAIARQPPSAGQNLFFSPYSVSSALAMTYAGAAGSTATQMASALHFTLPPSRLHPAFDWLDLQLASRGQGATGARGVPFRLHVANSVWGQKDMTFGAPFLDTLATSYGAGIELADFAADPEGARVAIDGWVSDRTNGKLPQLLGPGTVTPDTRFMLVNAVYFDAAWDSVFDASKTAPGDFHALDGSTVSAPLMHQGLETGYAEGDGWQAASLAYDGDQLSMLVVLPAAGTFAAFESQLSAAQLAAIGGALQPTGVTLTMPKFTQQPSPVDLSARLQDLGMVDPFGAAADFSPITASDHLRIGEVIHQAYIAVDEQGTEAAGATAVGLAGGAAPTKVATLTLDRPFLFAIRDDATGTILFLGRVASP